jgi:3-phenylpropionate/cinnamic acid dioxygenase small subunit
MTATSWTDELAGIPGAIDPSRFTQRVRSDSPAYAEVFDFLLDEVLLLDHDRMDEWFALLADDLVYRLCVRQTVHRAKGLGVDPLMSYFDDDHGTMQMRIQRLHSLSAYSEDPPSRVRRFVTNVRVHAGDEAGEYAVTSYLLVLRSRWDSADFEFISVERNDLLRRTDTSFEIARRFMYPDQSVLGTANLAIFL